MKLKDLHASIVDLIRAGHSDDHVYAMYSQNGMSFELVAIAPTQVDGSCEAGPILELGDGTAYIEMVVD